jgi:hypothetical protein
MAGGKEARVKLSLGRVPRFELSPTTSSLAYNLTLTLVIRNPNWAMSLKNTKPPEASYKFDEQVFDRFELARRARATRPGRPRAPPARPGGGDSSICWMRSCIFEWVPQIGVEERFLRRGDGEEFLVNGEKKRGVIENLLKEFFLSLITIFLIFLRIRQNIEDTHTHAHSSL